MFTTKRHCKISLSTKIYDNRNGNHFSLNDVFPGSINVSLVRKLHHIIYDLGQRVSLMQALMSQFFSSFLHNLMAPQTSKVAIGFIHGRFVRQAQLMTNYKCIISNGIYCYNSSSIGSVNSRRMILARHVEGMVINEGLL
jgi:hypothetical protein